MRFVVVLGVLALALAGCAGGGNWEKDPNMPQVEKDKAYCQAESNKTLGNVYTAYDDCMAAHGYRKTD